MNLNKFNIKKKKLFINKMTKHRKLESKNFQMTILTEITFNYNHNFILENNRTQT